MPAYLPWAIGAGALSALLYASLLIGGPLGAASPIALGAFIVPYFAQAPLFLIGLWVGVGGVALAAFVASLILFALGGLLYAVAFLAVNAAPAVFMTRQALLNRTDGKGSIEWYSAGLLVTWLVSIAAAAFFAMTVWFLDRPGGLQGAVSEMLRHVVRLEGAPEAVRSATEGIAHFLPGVIAGSWLVMVTINGAIAQGLLARFKLNLRPPPDLATIELPRDLAVLGLIAGLGALAPGLAGFLGVNLAMLIAVAYGFVGFGVLHTLARRWPNRRWWLAALYLFVFVFGWPIIAVVVAGLLEPWLRLRARLSGGAPKA